MRNLALQYPRSALNDGPLLVYLTARDRGRGEAAVQRLETDRQLKSAKALAQDGGLTDVKYHPLDISDSRSIDSFCEFLKKEHPEGIDVLVNNAGVALDGFGRMPRSPSTALVHKLYAVELMSAFPDASVVRKTLQCNYYGTLQMTQSVLPLLKPASTSRIVNVSSMIGKLNKYSPALTSAFRNASSVSEITNLMQSFQKSVEAGTHTADGWPSSAYAVSKAGVTGMTKVIAAEQKKHDSEILLNSCCPGYVQTDLTKGRGRKTPDQGAQTPVKLALGNLGGTSGEFWEYEEVSQW